VGAKVFGVLDMVAAAVGDEWNSGAVITVPFSDQDLNKNTLVDEDLVMANTTSVLLQQ
jgi:hypothetical protein